MTIDEVTNEAGWDQLLAYYIDCLREENRLRYVIKAADISTTCFFLRGIGGSFLSAEQPSLILPHPKRAEAEKLQRFVMGEPHSTKRPTVSFGYPCYVDRERGLIPLLHVRVSGARVDNGVVLSREGTETEINLAAIWESLPGDREIALDDLLARFDAIGAKPGESWFEQALALLVSEVEQVSGAPTRRMKGSELDPNRLPCHSIVECPVLFHVSEGFANQLLRELNRLREEHGWAQVEPALRNLLARAPAVHYSEVPRLSDDPRLYVLPANDRQRKAIASASQRPLTVVTGPPGTGKSQLIVNVVGDAVLKGETVLIASRNNQAVDVISERFLEKVDYPGAVRTGRSTYRQELPAKMQSVFAPVRAGGLKSQMGLVRSQHDELLRGIDRLRHEIAEIERLSDDQQAYRVELRDTTSLMPAEAGESIGKVQMRLTDEENAKVSAALRSLAEEVDSLIDRQHSLEHETQAVLVENRDGLVLLKHLEAIETRQGVSLGELRPSLTGQALDDLGGYLARWETLIALLSLQEETRRLREKLAQAELQAKRARAGLPTELASEVGGAADRCEPEREQTIHQALEKQRRDMAELGLYGVLKDDLTGILGRSGLARRALSLLEAGEPGEGRSPDMDLISAGRLCLSVNEILAAHQAGTERACLEAQLASLKEGQARRLAEFDAMLSRLDSEVQLAGAEVSAPRIVRMEGATGQGAEQVWEAIATQLSQMDDWCVRIASGRLTIGERLRRLASREWARDRLCREWRDREPLLVSLAAVEAGEAPGATAPFGRWAIFVHDVSRFAKATSLASRRSRVARQRETFRTQTQPQIDSSTAKLREAEGLFLSRLDGLPGRIADAMVSGGWSFEPLDPALGKELGTARDQYAAVARTYSAIVAELDSLSAQLPLPKALAMPLRAVHLPERLLEEPRAGRRADPEAVTRLIDTWQRFSQAAGSEHALRVVQDALAEAERIEGQAMRCLPESIGQVDLSVIPYSDELVRPMKAALSNLREGFAGLAEQWRATQAHAAQKLHGNAPKSPVLEKALEQSRKDPGYLGGLAGHTEYSSPEALGSDLRVWQLAIRAWDIMTQLARLGEELRKHPALDEARAQMDRLVQERQAMAGQVLAEQWKLNAAQLDPEAARQIDRYLDAIEALLDQPGSSYRALKQRAEGCFEYALRVFPVWSTTNLSTQDIPLRPGLFDCVIIDEASQCDIPSALPLLYRAKRIVIIGDENQLRHIATLPRSIHQQLCDRHSIGPRYSYVQKSLFDLAAQSTGNVPGQIQLNEHYRSHEQIIEFANDNFYGYLQVRTDLSRVPTVFQDRGCGLYWIDVKGQAVRPGPSQVYNDAERQCTQELLRLLLPQLDVLGLPKANIGVVTPFRAQADRIRGSVKGLDVAEERVLIGTVHTYQGDERDIMILSTVATGGLPEKSFRFMSDSPNLLNVAVTRARLTLVVVGDHGFFSGLPGGSCYQRLAAYADRLGQVYPEPKALPLFLPVAEEEKPFAVGRGVAVRGDRPYANRMTLRRLLASCQDYVWWYDPYLSVEALDALALGLAGHDGQIREVRLLTGKDFWENQSVEPKSITKKAIGPLRRELVQRGIALALGVTVYDPDSPPPHDRYLFSANQAVNMPPIKNIYQSTARLAEFLPSTVEAEEFESWWQHARVVFP